MWWISAEIIRSVLMLCCLCQAHMGIEIRKQIISKIPNHVSYMGTCRNDINILRHKSLMEITFLSFYTFIHLFIHQFLHTYIFAKGSCLDRSKKDSLTCHHLLTQNWHLTAFIQTKQKGTVSDTTVHAVSVCWNYNAFP